MNDRAGVYNLAIAISYWNLYHQPWYRLRYIICIRTILVIQLIITSSFIVCNLFMLPYYSDSWYERIYCLSVLIRYPVYNLFCTRMHHQLLSMLEWTHWPVTEPIRVFNALMQAYATTAWTRYTCCCTVVCVKHWPRTVSICLLPHIVWIHITLQVAW